MGASVGLLPRDFDAVQRTILELYAHRDAAAFRQAVPDLFLRIIPAEYVLVFDCSVDPKARILVVADHWESGPRWTPELRARAERFGFDHPFTRYTLKTGDPTALKFSDFFSLRQFRDMPLYDEFYRHAGITRLLGIGAPWPSGMTTINSIRRASERDFSERDREVLNRLLPHFVQARRNAERCTAARAAGGRPLETYDLTPRETEVAGWLGQGKTNLEIALILKLDVRTVEKHVERILEKLAVATRTAAALIIAGGARGG
jgi:DNA-binding CsgD family transcriptional regulator